MANRFIYDYEQANDQISIYLQTMLKYAKFLTGKNKITSEELKKHLLFIIESYGDVLEQGENYALLDFINFKERDQNDYVDFSGCLDRFLGEFMARTIKAKL